MKCFVWLFSGVLFAVGFLCTGCRSLCNGGKSTNVLLHWDSAGETLSVQLDQLALSHEDRLRILTFLDGERKIFSYSTADNLLGAIPLADTEGDLFTLWIGGSSYHFVVFGFRNGKVEQLLEGGSRMLPEIVSSSREDATGPMILATDGLVTDPRANWTTQIFVRTGDSYSQKGPVPFLRRFLEAGQF